VHECKGLTRLLIEGLYLKKLNGLEECDRLTEVRLEACEVVGQARRALDFFELRQGCQVMRTP
jgi:hypothetical protein